MCFQFLKAEKLLFIFICGRERVLRNISHADLNLYTARTSSFDKRLHSHSLKRNIQEVLLKLASRKIVQKCNVRSPAIFSYRDEILSLNKSFGRIQSLSLTEFSGPTLGKPLRRSWDASSSDRSSPRWRPMSVRPTTQLRLLVR